MEISHVLCNDCSLITILIMNNILVQLELYNLIY